MIPGNLSAEYQSLAKSGDRSYIQSKVGRMGVRDTAFALVASTIGGELIALPYAMSHLGLYLGILAIIGIGFLSHVSSMMYLKVGDLVPGNHKSVFELAYALSGRSAIFVVCIVQYFLNFFKIVLYYMIIGDTFS